MCLCVLLGLDLGEDVGLAEHEQILAVDLDLGAAVLGVEDLVALRDVERNALLALVVVTAVADGDDLALLRLFLGGVGEDDAAGGRLLLLDRPHDEPVAQGLELHVWMTSVESGCGCRWHSPMWSANRTAPQDSALALGGKECQRPVRLLGFRAWSCGRHSTAGRRRRPCSAWSSWWS